MMGKIKKAMDAPLETGHTKHQIDRLIKVLELTLEAMTKLNNKVEELERRVRVTEMSTT